MKITGIICEYNPLHLGHKKQMEQIRYLQGENSGIVCLMSGNFVQRGAPAILDKSLRAKAAILSGADLVLELPITVSLSSAEGFASGGVSILSPFCDALCFGAENADKNALLETAQALLQPEFSDALRIQLGQGLSFPAARQAALEAMGIRSDLVAQPNNILAVEYCKAILRQNSSMEPLPISRPGSYHDTEPDPKNPSATALRLLLQSGGPWQDYVPKGTVGTLESGCIHTLEAGERAILYRLRTMSDQEFEALPYGSEGLWRKLMHSARKAATLEQIIGEVKSKRYTRTRLDRMIMCAFLGISLQDLMEKPPYVRVLAFNDRGREILKLARETGEFPNAGQQMDDPYQLLENRWEDCYALFARSIPDPAGQEPNRRVYYHNGDL